MISDDSIQQYIYTITMWHTNIIIYISIDISTYHDSWALENQSNQSNWSMKWTTICHYHPLHPFYLINKIINSFVISNQVVVVLHTFLFLNTQVSLIMGFSTINEMFILIWVFFFKKNMGRMQSIIKFFFVISTN